MYEHPLSKEELRIDVLVIKKEQGVDIEKNIGKMFRAINLFEFKSEQDSLTVDDYHKVMGYAYFYASSVRASLSDITIEENLFIKNLRSDLSVAEAQRVLDAYKKIKDFESKNAYINRLVRANPAVFKEMMELSDTAIKDIVIVALAEDMGLLDERDRQRDFENAKQIARGFKNKNYSLSDISEITGLSLQEVVAL